MLHTHLRMSAAHELGIPQCIDHCVSVPLCMHLSVFKVQGLFSGYVYTGC